MALFSKVFAGGLKALGIIKAPKTPSALPPPASRDDAAARIAADDELRRRQGGAADILNGTGGAEPASAGGKVTLGS